MTNMSNTLVALFETENEARAVVEELVRSGFSRDEVHLSSGGTYTSDVAAGGSGLSGRAPGEHHGGGFMAWLGSLFGDDDYAHEDAGRYDRAVQHGNCVVAVNVDDEARREEALDIMNRHGALDIDRHAAAHGYDAVDDRKTRGATSATVNESSIPVVEEQLEIGKRAVQRGGVRVYSRVVEQPVERDVQLREERVRVERRPVNRPLTDADSDALREQTIEVTEMREEPVVTKQARVVEEVRVGKETTSRTEKVREKVKRTEIETEPIHEGSSGDRYSDDFRRDFETRYGSSGRTYESYAPAYEYGRRMAGDQRYSGRNWSDVESTLKTDYLRNNPNSTWDQAKGAVRYGWEKVTGQR